MLIEIMLLAGRKDAQKQALFVKVVAATSESLRIPGRLYALPSRISRCSISAVGGIPKALFPGAP